LLLLLLSLFLIDQYSLAAFRLMGAEMYTGMSALQPASPVIARGIAMHKMIRTVTMALGGEAYPNFMGNEFGHPEWIDFPREGNGWSYAHCRRQWGLVDERHLRYSQLNAWDTECLSQDKATNFMSNEHQWVTLADDARQVLVAERGPLVFVFNFSPTNDYEGLAVPTPEHGIYQVVLDSDEEKFGGMGRIGHGVDHFTKPVGEGEDGEHPGAFADRGQFMRVLSPSRTVVAYAKVNEEQRKAEAASKAKAKPTKSAGAQTGKSPVGAAATDE